MDARPPEADASTSPAVASEVSPAAGTATASCDWKSRRTGWASGSTNP